MLINISYYEKYFSTKVHSILAVCICKLKCLSNFHKLRKEKGLFIVYPSMCVFTAGCVLGFLRTRTSSPGASITLPLFSLSVNTYWISCAAKGRGDTDWHLWGLSFVQACRGRKKEHQEGREECLCMCVCGTGDSESASLLPFKPITDFPLRIWDEISVVCGKPFPWS